MPRPSARSEAFRALHARCFVIANAWDAGSARILAGLGFQALATSSGAHAGTLGKRDGMVTREEALEHARAIVEATELPVSADFERCWRILSVSSKRVAVAKSCRINAISSPRESLVASDGEAAMNSVTAA